MKEEDIKSKYFNNRELLFIKKHIIYFVLCLILLLNCSDKNNNKDDILLKEKELIYSKIIDSLYIKNFTKSIPNPVTENSYIPATEKIISQILVYDSTVFRKLDTLLIHSEDKKMKSFDIDDSLVIRFNRLKKKKKFNLNLVLDGKKIIFLGKELYSKNLIDDRRSRYKYLLSKYPYSNGILYLSDISFNRSRNKALSYIELDCGSKCGFGEWVVLKKNGSKWEIVNELLSFSN